MATIGSARCVLRTMCTSAAHVQPKATDRRDSYAVATADKPTTEASDLLSAGC